MTLQGSNFTGASSVLFGGASASGIAVQGDTVIVATSPPGTGIANLSVITPAGSSAIVPASQFTYDSAGSGSGSQTGIPDQIVSMLGSSLVNAINSVISPDMLEAQNIILRRIALESDVANSRIPPPRNITEIGGYVNLLTTLNETAMRQQTLAGALGVAGPNAPLGWDVSPPLAMVAIPNDRPAGPAQPSLPLNVLVRSDFVSALKAAIVQVHQFGAYLPLTGPSAIALPAGGTAAPPPASILPYLGRAVMIAAEAALLNPQTDPIAIVRRVSTIAFELAANIVIAAPLTVTPDSYDAVTCTATSQSTVSLTGASFVMLAPILANAGFYSPAPVPMPANTMDSAWAVLTNTTGLVIGTTRLGDELNLLYTPSAVAASVFASMLDATWDGGTFS